MKQKYRRLREIDRGVIYRMKKAGNTQSEIAQALGFSQGTVSKELKRNTCKRGYREKQSQKLAEERLKLKSTKIPIIVGD